MPDIHSLPPNPFKRNLLAGERQLGFWLVLESETATEVVAGAGFDWMLLDMEHTSLSPGDVVRHLRAARGGTAELVVRVPTNEPVLIKRLLDGGVRSFLFPMINSAADARAAVASTRYPPAGMRGVAGNTRASNFSRIPTYLKQAHEEICVIVQIESRAGEAAIAEIGAVDGVDSLFVGPNDLAASMGFLGNTGAPEVKEIVLAAAKKIRDTGKVPGVLNYSAADAPALFAAGYQFMAVGSDANSLARRSEVILDEFRALSAPIPS
jgi:4-hydroxy-2-oxoheptanedioate aldolase